jgi:hypothetical protein
MMKKFLLSVSLVLVSGTLISGCASQTQLAKIDDHEWTELKCSGFLTWHECRQEARAICPNGFYIADQLENVTIQRREVSVACKS